ncbi:hypothetical protein K7432_008772 [Basidiobolus ranarum]|uniref:Uncharacterized protein n=1 Tax=Basidiobolus ranarum TaxID=34480 RepID=A0ABR2VY33_9FUNG
MTPLVRQNTRNLWVPLGNNQSIQPHEVIPAVATAELALPNSKSRLSGRPCVDHLCKFAAYESLASVNDATVPETEYTSFPHNFETENPAAGSDTLHDLDSHTPIVGDFSSKKLQYISFPISLHERSLTEPLTSTALDTTGDLPIHSRFRSSSLPDLQSDHH